MKNFFNLLLISFFSLHFAQAQDLIPIKGKIVDANNEQVAGVMIAIDRQDYHKSDSKGEFEATMFSDQNKPKVVEISKLNFKIISWDYSEENRFLTVTIAKKESNSKQEKQDFYYYLKGQVLDKEDKRIANLTVKLLGYQAIEIAKTNNEGYFSLKLLKKPEINDESKLVIDGKILGKEHFTLRQDANFILIHTEIPKEEELETEKEKGEKNQEIAEKQENEILVDTIEAININQTSDLDTIPKSYEAKEFDRVLDNLEIEKEALVKSSQILEQEIDKILEQLSDQDSTLTEEQKTELKNYAQKLQSSLNQSKKAFSQVENRTNTLIDRINTIVYQKDSIEQAAKERIEAVEQEKDKIQSDSNRNLLIFIFVTLLLLSFALIYYRISIKVRKQRNQLSKAQKQLVQHLNQINSQKTELTNTVDKLQGTQLQLIQSEKMASLGQLTAGIAHEINNPINFVYAGVGALQDSLDDLMQLLMRYSHLKPDEAEKNVKRLKEIIEFKEEIDYEELSDDIYAMLADIKLGANRTIGIVKGLRQFSRLDEANLKEADIHEGLNTTLILLKSQLREGIEVVKNYDPNLPMLFCYPGQLNQVFMNLLTNSIHALNNQGVIHIITKKTDELTVEIRIKDTGEGIKKEALKRIFEPFFTTKDIGKGTGLGLSISYGIIEKHKGTIRVESEEGKGTEFIITLPLRQKAKKTQIKI